MLNNVTYSSYLTTTQSHARKKVKCPFYRRNNLGTLVLVHVGKCILRV